ncbi:MAG: S-methyl-5'-thioadenosine phosphorylase [Candidatus Aenigmatarchaeota archaeon]
MNETADIAIIGGTGVYDIEMLKGMRELNVETPYGKPSDLITVGEFNGVKIAFLPRHGKKHSIPPHKLNFRANIWALKQLGVKRIIAAAAVGSLQENIKPGDFLIPDQFIDRTHGRNSTFFDDNKVAHISVAEPFCPELSKIIFDAGKHKNYAMHENGTVVVVQGPRFSTKAESKYYKSMGGDIINMTVVPECVLAREAEMCYACIATVTDYDTFSEKPVNVEDVIKILHENSAKTKELVKEVLARIPEKRNCKCSEATKGAFV